jgi:tripartite-type tricarboxylate transporter receptor subunit TctC
MKLRHPTLLFAGFILPIIAATWVATANAQSSAWPSKPIKYIVPFAPGGVSEGVARLIAQGLAERLGQPVTVENRAGVSGIVGTQAAARATPDGYTLIGGTITTHAVNPFFTKNLGYDPVADFSPINLIGMVSNVTWYSKLWQLRAQ